jgi:hypothetical protein
MKIQICLLAIFFLLNSCDSKPEPEGVQSHTVINSNGKRVSPTVKPEATSPVVPEEIQLSWEGTSQGYNLDWDGKDLSVQADGKKHGIFSQVSANYCRVLRSDPESRNCYCGNSFNLTSVVGKIVSFEDESDFSCSGSHTYWRYTSLDLAKPGDFVYPRIVGFEGKEAKKLRASKMIALSDLFSETDIFAGILANSQVSAGISRAIGENKVKSSPTTLAEFSGSFAGDKMNLFNDDFHLEKDYLSRFVFHHLDGDKVAVWISLTPSSHAGQANHEHIEILLPIPEKLREPLMYADIGQQGFLMKDAAKFVGTTYAKFEHGPKD